MAAEQEGVFASGGLKGDLIPHYSGFEASVDKDVNRNGYIDDQGNYQISDASITEGETDIVIKRTNRSKDSLLLQIAGGTASQNSDFRIESLEVSFAEG